MDKQAILKLVDHTLLSQTATFDEIKKLADDGIKYGVAMLCIPNCYIKAAAEYVGGRVKIGGLAGFPHGNAPTEIKCAEAAYLLASGASEVDMVANLGLLRARDYIGVQNDISAVKRVCGDRILKVIIETCLLTEDEKIRMCKIVSQSGADFIKTSTGFSKYGATFEDVALLAQNVTNGVKVKAAGGIRTFEDAEKYINLGASRLGTSALVKLMNENNIPPKKILI